MWHVIKNDLNLRPFKTEVTKNLTEDEILIRGTKRKKLLRKMTIKRLDETYSRTKKFSRETPFGIL